MTAERIPIEDVLIGDLEHWEDGPPHELFEQMRNAVPGPLDAADPDVPRGGRLLVDHHGPTTSRRSAATGRPSRPSAAESPR